MVDSQQPSWVTHAQAIRDFGSIKTPEQEHREAELKNANIQFINDKIEEIKSNPTPPTCEEVNNLFIEVRRRFDWTYTGGPTLFSRKFRETALEYYKLADAVIEKWRNKESMTPDERLWIVRHLIFNYTDMSSIDRGMSKQYVALLKDDDFYKKLNIDDAIRLSPNPRAFDKMIRHITSDIRIPPAPMAPAPVAPAPVAPAPVAPAPAAPAPAAPAVDARLMRLMEILEEQKNAGMMSDGDYLTAMNDLKSLNDDRTKKKGGSRHRRSSKHSNKCRTKSKKSKKSRKTKSRRH